jgi:nicotinate-nucleotide adenylyltransferase
VNLKENGPFKFQRKYCLHKKVGLFGGSFNPVHTGHVQIALLCLKKRLVNEVWILPCGSHAFGKKMTGIEHRINMCNLSFHNDHIIVKDYDNQQKFEGKTYLMLEHLLRETFSKNITYFYIIGMDNANNINKWYMHEKLIKVIPFIVFPRSQMDAVVKGAWYTKKPHILLNSSVAGISSSEIRRMIGMGKTTEYLSDSVVQYIKENGLYCKMSGN